MTCDEFSLLLDLLADGELSGEALSQLTAHASSCESCAQALQAQKLLSSGLKALKTAPPDGFADGVMYKLSLERRKRGSPRFAFGGFTLAAAALILIAYVVSRGPAESGQAPPPVMQQAGLESADEAYYGAAQGEADGDDSEFLERGVISSTVLPEPETSTYLFEFSSVSLSPAYSPAPEAVAKPVAGSEAVAKPEPEAENGSAVGSDAIAVETPVYFNFERLPEELSEYKGEDYNGVKLYRLEKDVYDRLYKLWSKQSVDYAYDTYDGITFALIPE